MSEEIPSSNASRKQLSAARHALLHLHKALLDRERGKYEQAHGRVSAQELLRLALNDPQFAWLKSLSQLIVRIDELLEADDPPAAGSDIEEMLAGILTLLAPADGATNFAREYESALQGDPDIAVHHGYVMRELQQR